MTRETKIGLLVGLAFVIVVGILLSDHLTAATEPPAAPLRLAGDMVRTSLGETAVADLGGVVRIPATVLPIQPVPTARELAARTGRRSPFDLTAMARADVVNNTTARDLPATPPPVAAARKAEGYKAESGDTLGSIASKAMGANNKANRDGIVAANPSLQANPNMIVAGRTYAIPAAAVSPTKAAAAAVAPDVPVAAEHYRHGRRPVAD